MRIPAEILLVLSNLLSSVHCVFEMLSESGDFSARAGFRINLQCRFEMPSFNIFPNPIIWSKVQNNTPYPISQVGDIRQPFLSAGRFSVHFDNSRPQFGMTLSIKSLKREDEGEYMCEVRSASSGVLGSVFYSIYVTEPATSVRVTMGNSSDLADKSLKSLNLIDGQAYSIKCVISGGYPVPDTEIFVGDRNVTEAFPLYRSCRTTGYNGLRGTYCEQERWTESYHPTLRDDSNSLYCIAKVPGLDPLTAVTQLHVYYAPVVLCSPTTANLGDTRAFLSCTIRGKPRVSVVYWELDEQGTRLDVGQVVSDYRMENQDKSSFELQAKLFFKVIRWSNFRKYTLVAENDVGITSSQAELLRDYHQPDTKPLSYAPMTSSSGSTDSAVFLHSSQFVVAFSQIIFTLIAIDVR